MPPALAATSRLLPALFVPKSGISISARADTVVHGKESLDKSISFYVSRDRERVRTIRSIFPRTSIPSRRGALYYISRDPLKGCKEPVEMRCGNGLRREWRQWPLVVAAPSMPVLVASTSKVGLEVNSVRGTIQIPKLRLTDIPSVRST